MIQLENFAENLLGQKKRIFNTWRNKGQQLPTNNKYHLLEDISDEEKVKISPINKSKAVLIIKINRFFKLKGKSIKQHVESIENIK